MTSTRSQLYRAARLLGDVQAVRRGPRSAVKRVARKAVYRHVNRHLGRLLRTVGL